MEASDAAPRDLPAALGRLRVALDDAYVRSSRRVGLTPQQAELLCAALAPAPIKELAQRLRCDRSNVTRLVDRAAGHGHTVRRGEEEDGRVTVVELTPAGEELARRFLAELEAQTEALRASWPPGREANAAGILYEIAESLDAASAGQGRGTRRRRSAERRTVPAG
jgi:DNA-binding MarR family transcriptional regulator